MKEKNKNFQKFIEPLALEGNENVADFVENVYGNSGYNARKLADACRIFSKMIRENSTICITLAGAMTPIGMGGPLIRLVENGFVDFIISTGANLYHDLHRAFDYPVMQGSEKVDDERLYRQGISRIYDVFIEDGETLLNTDKCIIDAIRSTHIGGTVSTAELNNTIGRRVLATAPHPEKSLLATCAKHDVPVYTPAAGDSSIGMNIVLPYIFGQRVSIDPILDIIETTAIVAAAEKNGVVVVGGGAPKNFYLQTQPVLWQIFMDERGGHDYFIQLTTDSPQWGGLSGATPQEAKSWGKVRNPHNNATVVYSCASITFPILAQHALMRNKPRTMKKLYAKRGELVRRLIKKSVVGNKRLMRRIGRWAKPEKCEEILRYYEKKTEGAC
ncbi:MAG: deoxyhypusine synthase [Candidatus Micrarchaeia archaeon]